MNEDCLNLAKQIYAFKVVMTPNWDMQQSARDSVEAAIQFLQAIEPADKEPVVAAAGASAAPTTEPTAPPLTPSFK